MKNLTYRSVDIMKLSKDNATNPLPALDRQQVVTTLKTLNLTHIAISVPMDFPAYTKDWADTIHNAGLKVLYRPTWNEIEGLYGITRAVGGNRKPDASNFWRNKTKQFI